MSVISVMHVDPKPKKRPTCFVIVLLVYVQRSIFKEGFPRVFFAFSMFVFVWEKFSYILLCSHIVLKRLFFGPIFFMFAPRGRRIHEYFKCYPYKVGPNANYRLK